MIVGIDEVGRGCWAGPLCVAAVALGDADIQELTDSKLVTKKNRELYAARIVREASSIGIGWVSAASIDAIGLSKALTVAAMTALRQITIAYDEIILDGTHNFLTVDNVTVLKKADLLIPAVSAASLVAKVARDSYMTQAAELFPGYGFESHVGYGTHRHRQALDEQGPCTLHRMSFSPMANKPEKHSKPAQGSSGQTGEAAAAAYLKSHGFTIIERNWKTKWCEIDIIASKNGQTHFVEVKYRKDTAAGTGFDYITPKKQRQMKFAAEYWLLKNPKTRGFEVTLSAIEISGSEFQIQNFVTIAS